ncbi:MULTISPECIES: hypothetical protein [Clostridium]|jgi:hypothetical protein|uniref:hypothetical protein n=1 Tax=Clostridium TaxID=1485 RepID=UPI00235523D8|nr:hypothetical protein [Clostridium luticellarii]MCI1946310.1 hypothetical protein [Clostridium luticellarii]MCI1969535.1 hypothetical protein [Clostridium luticellarii]
MTKVMEDLAEEKLWIPIVISISYILFVFLYIYALYTGNHLILSKNLSDKNFIYKAVQ